MVALLLVSISGILLQVLGTINCGFGVVRTVHQQPMLTLKAEANSPPNRSNKLSPIHELVKENLSF